MISETVAKLLVIKMDLGNLKDYYEIQGQTGKVFYLARMINDAEGLIELFEHDKKNTPAQKI